MSTKNYLIFAFAIIVAAGGLFGSVGVPTAVAQQQQAATVQVSGDAARAAIDTALKAGRITAETAGKLTAAVGQGASVAVESVSRALVLNQNLAAVAAVGGGAGFAGGTLAAGAFIAGSAAVLAGGSQNTTGTTGTTGTR